MIYPCRIVLMAVCIVFSHTSFAQSNVRTKLLDQVEELADELQKMSLVSSKLSKDVPSLEEKKVYDRLEMQTLLLSLDIEESVITLIKNGDEFSYILELFETYDDNFRLINLLAISLSMIPEELDAILSTITELRRLIIDTLNDGENPGPDKDSKFQCAVRNSKGETFYGFDDVKTMAIKKAEDNCRSANSRACRYLGCRARLN